MPWTMLVIIAISAGLGGCTAYDFFGYKENTGLYVIERPKNYSSGRFGHHLAPTSTRAPDSLDLVAVSAGAGFQTIIYRLASGGKLVEVNDPWSRYPGEDDAPIDDWHSGAALAGLPSWGNDLVSGCIAVGEPGAGRVIIQCEENQYYDEIGLDVAQATYFGFKLAPIRPVAGGPWLLAAAADSHAVVLSDSGAADRSQVIHPLFAGEPLQVTALAAGRLADGRIAVALGTEDAAREHFRLLLYFQSAPHSTSLVQVACLERAGEPGFGGSLVAGDLDRDGTDELIVSAAAVDERTDAVYIYDMLALAAASPTCAEDDPWPLATLEPTAGELDVDCPDGCEFGTALALGDIATDDNGPELCVGAPGAKVKGKSQAGAVYLYRGAEVAGGEDTLAGQVTDSWPEKEDRFGGGLAVAPMAGRNELLVGVTGEGQVVIAFCSGVGENLEDGGDVPHNASGSLVSTRCRL